MKNRKLSFAWLLIGLLITPLSAAGAIAVSTSEAQRIGQLIWQNEAAGRVDYLTVWNEGEAFPSLGIGHFIWYPAGIESPFIESFPALRDYLQAQRSLPQWLAEAKEAPWLSREQFYREFEGAKLVELRQLLVETVPLQVNFIIQRMEQALPKMLQAIPEQAQREQVYLRFYRVANQPNGPYALIDYINFKGEGTAQSERYQDEGWGLLQVLQEMDPQAPSVMAEFVRSADVVLTRRVANAPRDESRWLSGWRKRLQSYLDPVGLTPGL